ncbi:MAG: TlpA disulfide reductase family protein [Hyphomicrobiaceae bacterium]
MMVSKRAGFAILALAFILPAAIGFGAVYVMARGADNAVAAVPVTKAIGPVVAQASPPAGGINSLSQGEMIKFVFKKEPEPISEVTFVDGAGAAKTLKDFTGKVVLLNLWATWCLPCRKEMPALDRLQAALGSDKFEVVALSLDRAGVEASRKFLESIKIANLKLYVDPTAKMNGPLKIFGMPTTILIDAQGREVGRLLGEAEWDSEDAKKLIRATLG